MHFSISTITAVAALAKLMNYAHALTYNARLGTPVCDEIEGQNFVDFKDLDCGSSQEALSLCNAMCFSQDHGCKWGGKSIIQRMVSLFILAD